MKFFNLVIELGVAAEIASESALVLSISDATDWNDSSMKDSVMAVEGAGLFLPDSFFETCAAFGVEGFFLDADFFETLPVVVMDSLGVDLALLSLNKSGPSCSSNFSNFDVFSFAGDLGLLTTFFFAGSSSESSAWCLLRFFGMVAFGGVDNNASSSFLGSDGFNVFDKSNFDLVGEVLLDCGDIEALWKTFFLEKCVSSVSSLGSSSVSASELTGCLTFFNFLVFFSGTSTGSVAVSFLGLPFFFFGLESGKSASFLSVVSIIPVASAVTEFCCSKISDALGLISRLNISINSGFFAEDG